MTTPRRTLARTPAAQRVAEPPGLGQQRSELKRIAGKEFVEEPPSSSSQRRPQLKTDLRRHRWREFNPGAEAAKSGIVEYDPRLMAISNGLDDRQPEAAAWSVRLTSTIEAVENTFAIFERNSGTGIADLNEWSTLVLAGGEVYRASRRGIAERVAHQITDQDAQRIVLTLHHTLTGRRRRA